MTMRARSFQTSFIRSAKAPALRFFGLMLFMLMCGAKADPVAVGIGEFNNSQTVIDFGSVTNGAVLSSQWSNVSFSANWWGNSNYPDIFSQNPDGMSASNVRPDTNAIGSNVGISFASLPQLVGFDIVANFGDVSVDVTNGFGQLQTFQVYATRCDHGFGGPPPCGSFAGFNDPSGISNISFHNAPLNNAFVLDNLRYQSPVANNVPEPSTAFLFAVGLLGLLGNVWNLRKPA